MMSQSITEDQQGEIPIIEKFCYDDITIGIFEGDMEQHKREFRIQWPKDLFPEITFDIVPGQSRDAIHRFSIINFSRQGMFLETNESVDIEPGTELDFRISEGDLGTINSSDNPIAGRATVKWVRPISLGGTHPRGMGIYLDEFYDEANEKYWEIFNQQLKRLKVNDLTVSAIPTVFPNTTLINAMSLFRGFRTQMIVVLDDNCQPVGILPLQTIIENFNFEDIKSMTVQGFIRSIDFSLSSHDQLIRAIHMIKKGNRFDIPVIDKGIYKGILPYEVVMQYWSSYTDAFYEAVIKHQEMILSEVAHELRTPLTYMSGIFEMLRSGDLTLDEFQSREITIGMEQNFDQIQNQIEELLDKSRLNRGQINLKKESISIIPFINEIVTKLQIVHKRSKVNIIHKLESENIIAFIDPRRLEQVVTNLVNNAVKFSEPGDNVVINTSEMGGFLEIRVEDGGEGIHPEIMDDIFHGKTPTFVELIHDAQSTGIGLNIVKKIVNAMGGKIRIVSDPGRGTNISVKVPLRNDPIRIFNAIS
jgi:signal transduction histidine kinase